MNVPTLDITLEAGNWDAIGRIEELCRRATDETCRAANCTLTEDPEIGIILSDDAHIRALNAQHRGKDTPTNVLSFPICDPDDPVKGPLLGDIVVSIETIAREAKTQQKTLDAHFCHLIVHGILHLFGYDHQIEQEAGHMEALETHIMGLLGFDDPYAGVMEDNV